jgi:hypothetical protein
MMNTAEIGIGTKHTGTKRCRSHSSNTQKNTSQNTRCLATAGIEPAERECVHRAKAPTSIPVDYVAIGCLKHGPAEQSIRLRATRYIGYTRYIGFALSFLLHRIELALPFLMHDQCQNLAGNQLALPRLKFAGPFLSHRWSHRCFHVVESRRAWLLTRAM